MVCMFVLGLVTVVVGVLLIMWDGGDAEWKLIIGMGFSLLGGITLLFATISYACAVKDCAFINKNWNKSYTVEEVFWNGEDIKDMLIGNKVRFVEE